ncbi:exopolysaccharide production protein YjbE [Methylobacterium sp.]|uniref:exopolysaccharide production protein YjbE n=1 Tax=Methylobacterium sp. TaxID=409 RepID=UPI003B01A2A9
MKPLKFALPALLALTVPALAAPCSTGAVKAKDPTPRHVDPKSSDVDRSSKNLAGGTQPASPGTIGAMNNAGADQRLGEKPGTETKIDQGRGVGTSSKNLAGGAQPASPGTIGAMNNAGVDQKLGTSAASGDGC